jgi:hypothetical protein
VFAICVNQAATQVVIRFQSFVGARNLMPDIMIKGVEFFWSIKTDQKHVAALFY